MAGSAAPSSYWGEKRDAAGSWPVGAVLSALGPKEGKTHPRPQCGILIGSIEKRSVGTFSFDTVSLFIYGRSNYGVEGGLLSSAEHQ